MKKLMMIMMATMLAGCITGDFTPDPDIYGFQPVTSDGVQCKAACYSMTSIPQCISSYVVLREKYYSEDEFNMASQEAAENSQQCVDVRNECYAVCDKSEMKPQKSVDEVEAPKEATIKYMDLYCGNSAECEEFKQREMPVVKPLVKMCLTNFLQENPDIRGGSLKVEIRQKSVTVIPEGTYSNCLIDLFKRVDVGEFLYDGYSFDNGYNDTISVKATIKYRAK